MGFINYAHRGASAYAPQNTFSAFKLGLQMQANGIETDVRISRDGVPVLFHDKNLLRRTGFDGAVEDLTFRELSALSVNEHGLSDKIPKFEDFLKQFGKEDITFAIELKGDPVEKETADLLRKYSMQEKTVVTSFMFSELCRFREYAPEFKTGYLTDEITDELLNTMKEKGIGEICPRATVTDKQSVEKWHNLGFNVRAWGIGDTYVMEYVYSCGVDGMTVNFPDKLSELIKKTK